MMYKVNFLVVLAVGLAGFTTPSGVSGRSQATVVKLSTSKEGGGRVYTLRPASKGIPSQVPQDIGPVCPPRTSCVNQ